MKINNKLNLVKVQDRENKNEKRERQLHSISSHCAVIVNCNNTTISNRGHRTLSYIFKKIIIFSLLQLSSSTLSKHKQDNENNNRLCWCLWYPHVRYLFI